MNAFSRLWRARQLRRDISKEIREHLEEKIDELKKNGLSSEDAAAAARREFGNITLVEESSREVWKWSIIENCFADLRYAARQLGKSPAFAVTAILTLALGIGANTAIFSAIDAVILQPLPYANPDRLFSVRSLYTRYEPVPSELSYPNFFDLRSYNHVFEHLVSFRDSEFILKTPAQPIHIEGEIVSWDLFQMLGVSPIAGRGFLPQEEKPGTNVVILSYDLWRSRFAGDAGLVGRPVIINGKLFTVAGIAPKNFRFPVQSANVQLWTTIAQDATAPAGFHPATIQRGARMIDAIGRLEPGVTLEGARAQMDSIASRLAKQYPDNNKNVARVFMRPELEELAGETREPLLILMGAVALLLLLACLNVANLLLARTTERGREFALRAAIGASRGAIFRQLLTESLFLALLGAIAGILLAFVSIHFLIPLAGKSVPRLENSHIDATVLAFSIAITCVTAVLFSFAPMTQVSKLELFESVKNGASGVASGRDRLRSALVVGQFTLGLVLLSGASLLAAAFLKLEGRDPGFRADHVLKFNVSLPDAQYKTAKQIAFDDGLIERLNAIPGVESAASGWPLPFEGDQITVSFDIQERPAPPSERPSADMAIVTPGFFHTLGIPLLRGRAFSNRDNAKAPPVVIVNQAFAERFFPGEDAVGKRIQSGATFGNKGPVMETIVGIVANARQSALAPDSEPIYYFPYKQLSWGFGWTILRTSVPPRNVESAARRAVTSLDPEVPVYDVSTMEESFSTAIVQPRIHMWLLGSFAAIAMLLITVGLYGVMAYSVSRRTREIGVRMAVGASRGTILQMIFGHAAILVLLGTSFGVGVARLCDGVLKHLLYGVQLDTWLLLAACCVVIAFTGAIATYLPARRAASIDPVQALRVE